MSRSTLPALRLLLPVAALVYLLRAPGVQPPAPAAGARAPAGGPSPAPLLHGVEALCTRPATPHGDAGTRPGSRAAPADAGPGVVSRAYPLPPLPSGHGWRVEGRLGALPSGALVAPADVPALLEAALAPTPWSTHAQRTRADGEAGTLTVEGPAALHEALEALLRSTAWTPEWLGAAAAAAELADLFEHGLPPERAWARAAWAAAPPGLRAAVDRERARRCEDDRGTRPAADGADALALTLRAYGLPRAALSDLIDVRPVSFVGVGSPAPAAWAPLASRSQAAYLDDCQLSALIRVGEKCPEVVPTLHVRTWTAPSGVEQVVDLGEHGLLRLQVRRQAAKPRMLDLWLRYRCPGPGEVRFVPVARHVLPEGGTLLLTAADTLLPAPEPAVVVALALTIEPMPSEPVPDEPDIR